MLTLVTGPSRSGKSRWAEHLALRSGRPVTYIATGPCLDGDACWSERLALHRRRRPADWTTWEVEGQLSAALKQAPAERLLLIDSLGTWLAHHLELDTDAWEREQEQLLSALQHCCSPTLIVAEETGWGVVPPTAIGGRFRDRLGALQQRLLPRCSEAWLVVHGRAIDLLRLSRPVPEL
jgi:adenosylcobinamide kinase/adenosylcobinamide-phosphate guanylyltransferase